MNIQKSNLNMQSLSFSGHKKETDKFGYEKHKFYYLYDSNKYNCDVELYNINKDSKGNYSISSDDAPVKTIPMKDGGISEDLSQITGLNTDTGFAYRFKLTDKKDGTTSYAFDNGSVIGIFDDINNQNNKFNVILSNRATINKNGPMQLIMPDEYYPGVEKNEKGKPSVNDTLRGNALSGVRTHANKLGGNFYGIIERLPEIEKEGVKRIVGMPYTNDSISSHKYWTENAFQVSSDFGSEEDFKTFQKELFKHGINWIADAALVNEGFGGIHLSELLRKGQDSVSKNMFRSGERISLGILPDKSDYTRMKIINAPFVIDDEGNLDSQNENYDASKPTYIQFYDERLVSEEQLNSDDIITTYDKKNVENNKDIDIYAITKHDDAVYPYSLEVNPQELARNVKRVYNENSQVDLSDIDTIKKVTDFTNFNVVNKSASAGLEVWDGNVDIAKLNFYKCDKDDERFTNLPEYEKQEAIADFERGALAVKDYAINSGKYWTQLTSDAQFNQVISSISGKAQTAEEYSRLLAKLVRQGELPKSVLENIDIEVIENVIDNNYHSKKLDDDDMRNEINPDYSDFNDYTVSDYILRKSMDMPLESLPIATNLLGIITSPYIAKKANIDEELGVSRFDITRADNPNLPEKYSQVYSQMDFIYENYITPIINEVINEIDGIEDDSMVSEKGKYILSDLVPDLTKYILVKALNPDADITIDNNGNFDFSNVNSREITMQSLGIPYSGKTAAEEAKILVETLEDRLSDFEIPSNIKEKLCDKFKNTSLNDFKIAEMIIDRTESGLGWRIDAAKDVASIDSVRAGYDSMTNTWNNVVDFWKRYNQSILEVNPHAYTTAEITDLYDLFANEPKSVFTSDADAERKFLDETGITAVANYNYFFSLLPQLFSDFNPDNNSSSWMAEQNKNFELRNKLDAGWSGTNPGFLFQSPDDGVVNSYTFVGNHDKPRAIHTLALDMKLFTSDFSNDEHKKIAAKCLMKDIDSIDFDKVDSMAVAMGDRLNSAFESVISDKEDLNSIKQAISELASGEYKGNTFDAAAFGTRPFEIAIRSVFEQAEYNGNDIKNKKKIEAQVLKNILEPAYDRFYSIYKLLITLPGSPTDFAGDRVAASGYETKAKNYHQQNRNIIHWEWLNDSNYSFVREFYEKMNEIANLRSDKKLSALNDGSTVTLPIYDGFYLDENKNKVLKTNENVQAMLRYNENSTVITLHDNTGTESSNTEMMNRKKSKIDRIPLCSEVANAKQGLKHGLKVGDKFKKYGDSISEYVVQKDKDGQYYIEQKVKNSKGVWETKPITIEPEDLNTLILYKV